ncbi:MAG TPA: hypothetical protein DCP90_04980 [Clostridiales bacterium]|nr:MAG: hypothetical protein A2Y22_06285 [Clostridiales bacterium GWD2_32_59]HAN09952.1 hypothetical protein [Clostridiales bacterium]
MRKTREQLLDDASKAEERVEQKGALKDNRLVNEIKVATQEEIEMFLGNNIESFATIGQIISYKPAQVTLEDEGL